MAMKYITVNGGTIDQGYRGELKVLLENRSNKTYLIGKGDRIAQLIVERLVPAEFAKLDTGVEIPSTDRGNKGFGSSGV